MMLPLQRESRGLMDRSPLLNAVKCEIDFAVITSPLVSALMLSPFLSVCHNRLQNASPHKKTTIRTPTDHPCTNEEPVSNRLMVSVNMLYLCASKCVHDWWSSRCQVVDFLLLLVYLFSHKRAVLDNSRTSSLCPFQSLLVVFVESVSTPKWSSSGFLKNHTVQFNWAKKYIYCHFRALLR